MESRELDSFILADCDKENDDCKGEFLETELEEFRKQIIRDVGQCTP